MTFFSQSASQNQSGNLPNFLIIGGMKCGTTSLHYYLNCHPDIFMPLKKELNFFIYEKNWSKGLDWYRSQFKGNVKIYGDASPNYTNFPRWPETAKLVYETIPNTKLIYLVRDPIKRMISHYVHMYADGKENRSIEDALADFKDNSYNPYVSRSLYYLQLKQYLEYFDTASILILNTEELYNFPEKVLPAIFKFLGVSDDLTSINYHKKLHKSIFKRRKTELGNRIGQLPLIAAINNLHPRVKYPMNKLIYFPFSTPVQKPILTPDLQNLLINYFKQDINKLRQFTRQSFSTWCA